MGSMVYRKHKESLGFRFYQILAKIGQFSGKMAKIHQNLENQKFLKIHHFFIILTSPRGLFLCNFCRRIHFRGYFCDSSASSGVKMQFFNFWSFLPFFIYPTQFSRKFASEATDPIHICPLRALSPHIALFLWKPPKF